MKLHNNMLAHQTTPADYIISYQDKSNLYLHLVECKQVTCKEGKGRLTFKRLKQMHDLLQFERAFDFHYSWFCLAWLDRAWKDSDVYIVPAKLVSNYIDNSNKVSMNRNEAQFAFAEYKADIKVGSIIDLNIIKS